jgi:hypothetical protein
MSRLPLLIVVLSLCSLWLRAGSNYVVVSATASPGYDRHDPEGALRPESYVISQGRNFGRAQERASAEEQFQQVLTALGPALAQQEYWPSNGLDNADLVIVVHWGETETYEDPMRDFMADAYNQALEDYRANADEAGNADPGRLNELKRMDSMTNHSVLETTRSNAELLGYRRSIEKAETRYFPSEEERTMKAELAEERYFVVLMAWDYAALREGKPALLKWVTRMSVRSAGNRFAEALPALLRQGAPHFGRQNDDLVRVRTVIEGRKAEVEIGTSTVVEDEAIPEEMRLGR